MHLRVNVRVSVLELNSRHGGIFHNKPTPPALPGFFPHFHFNKLQPQIQTLSRAFTCITVLNFQILFFCVCIFSIQNTKQHY